VSGVAGDPLFVTALTLAEVSDKLGVSYSVWAVLVFSGIAHAIGYYRWWFSFVGIVWLAAWDLTLILELREPYFGSLVLQELGHTRITINFVAINSAIVLVGSGMYVQFKAQGKARLVPTSSEPQLR
jgi:hypothetical protein